MRMVIWIRAGNFDLEDGLSNLLQDEGLQRELEMAIEGYLEALVSKQIPKYHDFRIEAKVVEA